MVDVYGDWYLPSFEEWSLLDAAVATPNFPPIGLNANEMYWSSTEYVSDTDYAYARTISLGFDAVQKSTQLHVRAIRKF